MEKSSKEYSSLFGISMKPMQKTVSSSIPTNSFLNEPPPTLEHSQSARPPPPLTQSSSDLLDEEIAQIEAIRANCPHHLGEDLIEQINSDVFALEMKQRALEQDV